MARRSLLPGWLVVSLVIVVGTAWISNFAARLFFPGYTPNPAVDGMMTLILGIALGTGALKRSEP